MKKELFCSEIMKEKFEKSFSTDMIIEKDLTIKTIEDGIIHPMEVIENQTYGGVTDKDFNLIKESLSIQGIGGGLLEPRPQYSGADPNHKNNKINYIDEEVVYIGQFKFALSHFYLETFSRAWFFLDEENLKYKIAYVVQQGDEPLMDLIMEFFEGIGLKRENFIEIKEPTKFKSVIIPEQSMEIHIRHHQLYKTLFDKLKEKVNPAPYKKVYFSKTFSGFYSYTHIGEDYADKIFKENGFEIFYPEHMNILETISVLKGCEVFAAQSGSNAHNALFLNDGVKCIVLNRSQHVHPTQTMIDKMRNLDTVYVDTCQQSLPVFWDVGPFVFMHTPYLEDFFNKYNFKWNKQEFIQISKENFQKYLFAWSSRYLQDFYKRYGTLFELKIENILNIAQEFGISELKREKGEDAFLFKELKILKGKKLYKVNKLNRTKKKRTFIQKLLSGFK